ncbi:MAG: type II secretion system F family protein [Phycisphaeraceae bacterium]|nr:type II secretion system F family protein [Phycisphaerae bacterium]MBX3391476.1 type II secretion system F family protein [Phycisphaeraceae bacterium]
MKFIAHTYSRDGDPAVETIEAATAAEAADILRRRGLLISDLKPAPDGSPSASQATSARRRSIRLGSGKRLKLLTGFLRQMSVLVSTGTPLVEAIASLERQADDEAWRGLLGSLRKRMEEGCQLSEAMADHPECFDLVCRNLVAAGESGGRLDEILTRLSSLVRQQQRIRGEVIGAMAYPSMLILISLGVLTAMIGFVLPRFEGLFKSMDRPVPASTQALLGLSNWLRENWWFPLIAVPAVIVASAMLLRTPAGSRWKDRALVRAPMLGTVYRSLCAARVARIIGVLLDGKVALLECLRLVRGTMGNSLYASSLAGAEDAVTRGEGASVALDRQVGGVRLFPSAVIEALKCGERSGKIAPVMISVADALDEDNDVLLRSATRLLEPLILSVLGVIVGLVTLSMFMPLFDLAAAGPMSGGGR